MPHVRRRVILGNYSKLLSLGDTEALARSLLYVHIMISPWMSRALPWFVVVTALAVLGVVANAPR